MMYVRFIFAKLLELLGWILGIVLFPLYYPLRFKIDNNPALFKILGLWYLTNQDEPNHLENWYGFYELNPEVSNIMLYYNRMSKFERFFQSFRWVALRNPSWQLKLAIGDLIDCEPSRINVKKVVGDDTGMVWRNKSITGMQFATFYLCGSKCFRYSFTKRVGPVWVNLMLGAQQGRYVSKFRVFRELGRWG